MEALSPAERAVPLAMSLRGVASWSDAALAAGAAQPEVFGERVGRKVKGLAARITGRRHSRHSDAPGLNPGQLAVPL